MNAIHVIHPRWEDGALVFDDRERGLLREPFVAGADTALGHLAARVDGCSKGFTLIFSDSEFPGHQAVMKWQSEEYGGNWYTFEELNMTGWLCPALLKYFDSAPERIYIEIRRPQ